MQTQEEFIRRSKTSIKDEVWKANELFETTGKKGESLGIDEKTLTTLHIMRKDALISLIQRVSGAMWGIGLQTEEQTAEAMLLKLAINGLTSQDNKDSLANINAWLDRKRGKPAQYIEQKSLVAIMEIKERREIAKNEAETLLNIIAKIDNN